MLATFERLRIPKYEHNSNKNDTVMKRQHYKTMALHAIQALNVN